MDELLGEVNGFKLFESFLGSRLPYSQHWPNRTDRKRGDSLPSLVQVPAFESPWRIYVSCNLTRHVGEKDADILK